MPQLGVSPTIGVSNSRILTATKTSFSDKKKSLLKTRDKLVILLKHL